MTEAEWKAAFIIDMWRQGDTTFESMLPSIIRKTNAAITRDVTIPTENFESVVELDDFGYGIMPTNRGKIVSVTLANREKTGLYFYDPHTMLSHDMPTDGYTITGSKIYVGGYPIVSGNPANILVTYQVTLEPWFDPDTEDEADVGQGFESRHPDFYYAKAAEHAAKVNRDAYLEDKSKADYYELLESVIAYELRLYYGDAGLGAVIPGVVA